MKKYILKKFALIIGLAIIFLNINVSTTSGQSDSKSTYEIGKDKTQKDPIPGEGNIIGSCVVLGKKSKVPLVFIEVEGGRITQSDTKGKFTLTLDAGTHNLKIACSGYQDLLIKDFTVKEGVDTYIKIQLAITETGKFK